MNETSSRWREVAAEVRNWGRWGPEDERGTCNLIGEEEVRRASALVTTGRVIPLGISFDATGPQLGPDRRNPLHLMSAVGRLEAPGASLRYNDDYVVMPLQCATQWDALSHVFYDDAYYSGFPVTTVTDEGASRLGIESLASGLVGRGVLLDVASYLDVPFLPAGTVITPAMLDGAAAAVDVVVRPGDILLVRTGSWSRYRETGDRGAYLGDEPGLGLECCRWLHTRAVAAVAADNWALEVIPSESPGEPFPLHMILIRDMGMPIGEMFDLDMLAATCATEGRFEFLFSATPLPITGAVGSPINPVAIL
jgi:kynurenine formamidase